MNLCLVSREYPPFFGGGIGTYTVRWSEALAKAGHRVVVVTVSDDGEVRRESRGGVTVVRLPFIAGQSWSGPHPKIATAEARAAFATFSPVSVFAIQVAAALPGLLEEFSFDAIEFPDTGALGWFVLNARRTGRLWVGERRGPPIVTTIHSPTEWIALWNRAPLRARWEVELAAMEEDCLAWSDGLVCPTTSLARWASERYGIALEKIAVVPNPIGELAGIAGASAAGAAAKSSWGATRVLFAGRLEPRKGVDTLVEGFGLAVAAGADLMLDLAGEDMPRPEGGGFGASAVARLPGAVRSRIKSHGKVQPGALASLHDAADIVAVPAPMDNYPYTCVEAMAQGRVVIASDAGGMGEMIRDGIDGVLFAPGDAAACGAALRRAAAMDGGARARLARNAAARILELSGNARVVEKRLEHLGGVRGARGGPSEERQWVVVDEGCASASAVEQLKLAATQAGAGFAHGWVREDQGAVSVFSTPRARVLARTPGNLGPLVVDAALAADPRIAGYIGRRMDGRTISASSREVALALLEIGARGVVVPEVVTTAERPARTGAAASTALERVQRAEAELAAIKGSRGWRVLERVYDVLHMLRGRGFRRR